MIVRALLCCYVHVKILLSSCFRWKANSCSEDTVSQHQPEENQDCDESLGEENASLGPKISYSPEAFHILSEAFNENRIISEAETSYLSDLICAPQKDVKWFYLKLRHLVREKNIGDLKDQISELLESLTQTPCGMDLITIWGLCCNKSDHIFWWNKILFNHLTCWLFLVS